MVVVPRSNSLSFRGVPPECNSPTEIHTQTHTCIHTYLIVSVIVRVWVFVVLGEKIGLEIFDFRSQGGDVTAHRHLLRRSERTQNLLDCIGNGFRHVDEDDANIG